MHVHSSRPPGYLLARPLQARRCGTSLAWLSVQGSWATQQNCTIQTAGGDPRGVERANVLVSDARLRLRSTEDRLQNGLLTNWAHAQMFGRNRYESTDKTLAPQHHARQTLKTKDRQSRSADAVAEYGAHIFRTGCCGCLDLCAIDCGSDVAFGLHGIICSPNDYFWNVLRLQASVFALGAESPACNY